MNEDIVTMFPLKNAPYVTGVPAISCAGNKTSIGPPAAAVIPTPATSSLNT